MKLVFALCPLFLITGCTWPDCVPTVKTITRFDDCIVYKVEQCGEHDIYTTRCGNSLVTETHEFDAASKHTIRKRVETVTEPEATEFE